MKASLGSQIGWTLVIAAVAYVPVFGFLQDKSESRYNGRSGYGRWNDLHQIGMALDSYADDYDRLPTRLWDLYDQYIDSARTLASPGRPGVDGGRGEWTLNQYHYLYEGGCASDDVPPGAPIVVYPYERSDGVGLSVLFRGGRVQTVSEDDFLFMMGADRREGR
jgi:hypothetical protein